MEERVRLSKEDATEQRTTVKKIEELTANIKKLTKELKGRTCRIAFELSVINLEKKCELYSKENVKSSPDEKKIMREAAQNALKEFRAQKENTEISPESTKDINESNPEISKDTMGKKKNKGR